MKNLFVKAALLVACLWTPLSLAQPVIPSGNLMGNPSASAGVPVGTPPASLAIPTINGTPATGNCTSWISSTVVGDAGAPCSTGGGGNVALTSPDLSLTVTGSGTNTLTAVVNPSKINFGSGALPVTAIPGNPCDTALVVDVNALEQGGTIVTNPATFAGQPAIDGVTVPASSMVLLKYQGAPAQNGLWMTPAVYNAGQFWHRPSCFQSGSSTQAQPGQSVSIILGTLYGGSAWALNVYIPGVITIDTTVQQWGEISSNGGGGGSGSTTDFCTNWGPAGGPCGDTVRSAGAVTWASGNTVTLPVTLPSSLVGANIIVGGLGAAGCGGTFLNYDVNSTGGTGVKPQDIFVGNEGTFSFPCWLQAFGTTVASATVATAGTSCPMTTSTASITANTITGITAATSAVITVSTVAGSNPFAVGNQIVVQNALGMTQINGKAGTVTAIGGTSGAYTVTVNINSSSYSAWTSGGTASNGIWSGTNAFAANEVVYLTGTLPAGFAINTPYFVESTSLSSSQFVLSSQANTAGTPSYVLATPTASGSGVTVAEGVVMTGTTGISSGLGATAYFGAVAPSNGSGGIQNPIAIIPYQEVDIVHGIPRVGSGVYLQNPQNNAANPVEPVVGLVSTSINLSQSTNACSGVALNLGMAPFHVQPIVSGVYTTIPTGTMTTASTQSVIYVGGAGLAAGATSASLLAIQYTPTTWPDATGSYTLTFSTGETRTATLTNGSANITWSPGLTSNETTYVYVAGQCNTGSNTCPTFPIQDQSTWASSGSGYMAFYGVPFQSTITAISGTSVTLSTTPITPITGLNEEFAAGHDDAPTWNNMLTKTAALPGLKVTFDPTKNYGIYSTLESPGNAIAGTSTVAFTLDCQGAWITALAPIPPLIRNGVNKTTAATAAMYYVDAAYWNGYGSVMENCNFDGFGQSQNIINDNAGSFVFIKNYEIDPTPTTNNYWQLSSDFLIEYALGSIISTNDAYNDCPAISMSFGNTLIQPIYPVCGSFGIFAPTSKTDTALYAITNEGATIAGLWSEEGATQLNGSHLAGNHGDFVFGSYIGGTGCGTGSYGPFDFCGGEMWISGGNESDGQDAGIPAFTIAGYGGTQLSGGWIALNAGGQHPGVMVISKDNHIGDGTCYLSTNPTQCVYVSPNQANGSTNTIDAVQANATTNQPTQPVNGTWNPLGSILEFDAGNNGIPGQRRASVDSSPGFVIYGTGASPTLSTAYLQNGYNRILSGATTTSTYSDTLPAITGTIGVGTGSFTSGDCVQYSGTAGAQADSGVACTSLNPLLLQSAIPFIVPGNSYMDATGNFVIGATVGASQTFYLSSNTAGTGITITFSAATLSGTSTSADTGRVLTYLDSGSGTYKTFIITGNSTSSTTVAQGTLNTTLTATCTSGSPCASTTYWLSGNAFNAANNAGAGVTYPAPLPTTYPSAYIYFQTTAPTATAGWYYCAGSYLTLFKCYNYIYTTGQPEIPASPPALSGLTPATYTPTLSTAINGPAISIAGGALGINGELDFSYQITQNDGGTRTYDTTYGGAFNYTSLGTYTTGTAGGVLTGQMTNTGVANSQVSSFQSLGTATASAPYRTSVNSASAQTFNIAASIASANDYAVIERYSEKIYQQN